MPTGLNAKGELVTGESVAHPLDGSLPPMKHGHDSLRVAFVGRKGMGGFVLRGVQVADYWRYLFPNDTVDVIDAGANEIAVYDKFAYDVVVLVKYPMERAHIWRALGTVLIWDAVDSWMGERWAGEPIEWFQKMNAQIQPDMIVTTSPACDHVVSKVCTTVMLPHSADTQCDLPIVRDDGDVYYFGGEQYLGNAKDSIEEACRRTGRKFWVDDSKGPWHTARPVACVLHFRLGTQRTSINVMCKPQVKLANAAYCKVPVLATCDPCVQSLRTGVNLIDPFLATHPDVLAHAITETIGRSGFVPHQQPSLDEHTRKLRAVATLALDAHRVKE